MCQTKQQHRRRLLVSLERCQTLIIRSNSTICSLRMSLIAERGKACAGNLRHSFIARVGNNMQQFRDPFAAALVTASQIASATVDRPGRRLGGVIRLKRRRGAANQEGKGPAPRPRTCEGQRPTSACLKPNDQAYRGRIVDVSEVGLPAQPAAGFLCSVACSTPDEAATFLGYPHASPAVERSGSTFDLRR